MGEGRHVQMLVDVVLPEGHEPWPFLTELIELLNATLHQNGLQETVWVARLPEDRV